eukprot:3935204-Rhodomonas_salina.1
MEPYQVTRTLAVKAPMGTGKSKAVCDLLVQIKNEADMAVVMVCITHCVTFCRHLLRTLSVRTRLVWHLYSDPLLRGRIDLHEHGRVMCQVESLRRLRGYLREPDRKLVVILDEWNTVMCTTVLQFATCEDKYVFEQLMLEADHVIALDAHLDQGTVNVLSLYRHGTVQYVTEEIRWFQRQSDHVVVHVNTVKTHTGKAIQFLGSREEAVLHVINRLDAGCSVVVPCHSKDLAHAINGIIQQRFGGRKRGFCYTADVDDDQKREHFDDPETHWSGVDYLIYTSMLEVGVSYERR